MCIRDSVVSVLTDNDYQKSRNYWKWLKNKLKEEGSEPVSYTHLDVYKRQDLKCELIFIFE